MQNAERITVLEHASVSQDTKEIRLIMREAAAGNAKLITNVLKSLHVFETSVSTLVLEHAALMQFVTFKSMFHCAPALPDILAIHSFHVNKNPQLHHHEQIHAYLLLADPTLNAGKLTTRVSAHAYRITLEALQVVDQSVS